MPDNDSLSPIERQLPQRISSFTPTTLELEAQGSEPHFTLASFWHIVVKRLPTIITATLVVLVLTAIYTFKMHPVYRATASIEVEPNYPQLQTLSEVYRQSPVEDNSFLTTQIQVLQSDSLAWRTMAQLGLDRGITSQGVPKIPGQSVVQVAGARKTGLIEDFKEGLTVEILKDSRLLAVSYESGNPEVAARVVNQLINNYSESNFQERNEFTKRASGGMEGQLEDLRAKMEKSSEKLVDYERQNLIFNTGDKQSINDQRLEELNKEYSAAENDEILKQSLYEFAQAHEGQVGIIVQSEVLQRLEEKYNDLKAAYADALSQYGPNFPKVARLRDQLTQLQSLMESERKLAVEKVHNDYLAALSREKLLGAALTKEKGEVSALNQRMIDYNILKREFEINQTLYEKLLQQLKDATLSASLQVTNVRVIDPATPPVHPIRPNKGRNIAAGLMVGLILAITLAFVQEALDSSVRTTEEAERLVNAPALAVIPSEADGYRRKQGVADRALSTAGPNGVGLAVLKRPSSPLAEAFRSLRTSVLLSTAPRPPQTLLVTSAQVGEGKTSTACNLAMSFAQRGGPVLIVDADLRRPSVAKTLGVSNEKGLSSFLTGAHSLDDVLIQYERVPNLWVLPAGPRPPDPAELLSSHMMEATLKDFMKRFTQIVIDSPPLLLVTDAVVLSAMVDGVILVVASGTTARGALARAHRILENAGSRVLGMVLNKVDMRFDTYYGSYYGPYHQTYYDEVAVSNPSHSSGGGRSRSKDSPRQA
ncbi:MAG TPA: polysaccharide biosynthesis tyrosine autokinase [Terriglobia bacterium]|nr:polysaccharide biosynthesis tyrosine autokinase [Terriglobia bacterium]